MLSIIIPTLNEEKYLPRLLESIKRQKFSDYEIIVSDGNSEDRTVEIAQANGCRTTSDSRRHPSYQRNNGARIARGDILLFLDADSTLGDNFLEKVVSEFNIRQLGVSGFYLKFGSNKTSYWLCALGYNTFCFVRQYISPVAVGAGIVIKREHHEQINGFDETLYVAEDYDYCARASRVGRFRILRSQKLTYSVRRMKREGSWRALLKWLAMGRYTLFNIPIRKKIIDYKMGGQEE